MAHPGAGLVSEEARGAPAQHPARQGRGEKPESGRLARPTNRGGGNRTWGTPERPEDGRGWVRFSDWSRRAAGLLRAKVGMAGMVVALEGLVRDRDRGGPRADRGADRSAFGPRHPL